MQILVQAIEILKEKQIHLKIQEKIYLFLKPKH